MGIREAPSRVWDRVDVLLVFTLQEPAPERSHDRVKVVQQGRRTVIALADGAGGMSGAAEAAEQVVNLLVEAFAGDAVDATPGACAETLAAVDRAVVSNPQAGETTGLLLVSDDDSVVGASVGDCVAWLVPKIDEPREITVHQMRKPRVGTGQAIPVGFGPTALDGVLFVMTDGVADYITGTQLAALVRRVERKQLPRTLLDDIRSLSGKLTDHATVVVASRHETEVGSRPRSG